MITCGMRRINLVRFVGFDLRLKSLRIFSSVEHSRQNPFLRVRGGVIWVVVVVF